MKDRFKMYISNFQNRKEKIENERNQTKKINYAFFTEQSTYKLFKMEKFLNT